MKVVIEIIYRSEIDFFLEFINFNHSFLKIYELC